MMPPNTASLLRSHIPLCTTTTYLASCSAAPASLTVLGGMEAFWQDWNTHGANWDTWIGVQEQVRALLAELLHARSPRQIALKPSVSDGLAALASAFHQESLPAFGGRRKVLISEDDFPTVGAIWGHQQVHGVQVVRVPEAAFRDLNQLEAALDEQALWLCISHVSYLDGYRHDLERIIARAHARGVMVCVDASQSAGTEVLDVEHLGAEVVLFGLHKYLYCPASTLACVWVSEEVTPRVYPTTSGWAAQAGFLKRVDQVNGEWRVTPGSDIWNPFGFRYHQDARRIEGSTAAALSVYVARAALQMVLSVGLEAIEAQIRSVTATMMHGALERGWQVKTPLAEAQRGPMVVLRCKEPGEFKHRLAAQHIHVGDPRGDGMRAACGGFTNDEDVQHFLEALETYRVMAA
jgi:selenocysteine lyase/cysteine desulfurase